MSLVRNLIENERPDIKGTGRLSTVTSNVLLSGNLALEDFAVTKNFATVLYTGNGDIQDVITGISSVDFTVSGNGSGYYNKRVGNGFAVIADDAVDLIDSSNDTSSVDNWTAGKDANLSVSDGVLSVNANTTDYPYALSKSVSVVENSYYFISANQGSASPRFFVVDSDLNYIDDNNPYSEESATSDGIIVFTGSNTEIYIQLKMNSVNDDDTATFSNLSILPVAGNGEGSCVVNTSKVHYKCRSQAYSNFVFDGLRGIAEIKTDSTNAEGVLDTGLIAFTQSGITLGSHEGSNGDTETYVLYQTLYTHIKWGFTSQNKFYTEAYNPITRETMIMYEGSGSAGHEIPHSLGVELDYIYGKELDSSDYNWYATYSLAETLWLNTNAGIIHIESIFTGKTYKNIIIGNDGHINRSTGTHILYGKAKSENWTIVEYTGTGAAGNFVETKDVYGISRRPARVIIKAVSDMGNWIFFDNKRIDLELYLDTSDAETSQDRIDINSTGITLKNSGASTNASGVQYIALVEFDTNSDGGDGYFNLPTDDSNLNLTEGVFSYTEGKDSNGYVRSTESLSGTTTIDFAGVSDGYKWVAKTKSGAYNLYDEKLGIEPNGTNIWFNSEDGKVYQSSYISDGTTNNSTIDAVPKMTSNTSPRGVCSASSVYDSDREPYGAFSNDGDTTYWYTAAGNPTGWIQYEFERAIAINKYNIMKESIGGRDPIDWTLQASNTGLFSGEEVVLHSVTGASFTSEVFNTYSFSNSTQYKYYRIDITDSSNTDYVGVGEIEFIEAEPENGTQLATPVSFLPNPVMVTSETPQYIDYNQKLLTNVIDSLEVSGNVKTNGEFQGKNACTAWVNFDPSGTIRDSYNVSSVVRRATGDYTITFLNAMANINYSVSAMSSGGYNGGVVSIGITDASTWDDNATVNGFRIGVRKNGDNQALIDEEVCLMFFGGK